MQFNISMILYFLAVIAAMVHGSLLVSLLFIVLGAYYSVTHEKNGKL